VSLFAAQNQHAPFAEGLDTRLGAEHLAGTGRERDASGRLNADDPVPPLAHRPVVIQIA
jgi:hypothetical protein